MNSIHLHMSPQSRALYLERAPLFGNALKELRKDLIGLRKQISRETLERMWVMSLVDSLGPETDSLFWLQENHLGESFGKDLCISVRECVAHGRSVEYLNLGDLVTIDAGASTPISETRRLHFDAAFTCVVGSEELPPVATVAFNALKKVGQLTGEISQRSISKTIQEEAWNAGLSIVTALVGHGIGYSMHEWPGLPNAVLAGTSQAKLPDHIFINPEPMFVQLNGEKLANIYLDDDGWSVMTSGPSAHWETTFYYDGERLHDIVGITGVLEEKEQRR